MNLFNNSTLKLFTDVVPDNYLFYSIRPKISVLIVAVLVFNMKVTKGTFMLVLVICLFLSQSVWLFKAYAYVEDTIKQVLRLYSEILTTLNNITLRPVILKLISKMYSCTPAF